MVGVITNHHLYNFTNHHNDSEMKMNHPDVHNTRAYAGVHDAYGHDRYHLHLLCAKHFLFQLTFFKEIKSPLFPREGRLFFIYT